MSRPKSQPSYDPNLSNGIIAIVLVVAAIIFVLSFFGKAGTAGVMLNDYVLSFLFGAMRFATPVVILVLAWYLIRDTDYDYRHTHGIGAFLFFVSLSSLFHLGFEPYEMWNKALSGAGGGVFGMFAWVLKSYLGGIAGAVILVGMVVISIFLIFNTSLTKFVILNKKLIAGFGWAGRATINLFKIFLKNSSQGQLNIDGDYEEQTEDQDDIVDEEGEVKERTHVFARKEVGAEVEQNEEQVNKKTRLIDDDEDTATENDNEEHKTPSVWDKRVIVKNLPPYSLLTTQKTKPTSGDIESNAKTIHDTLKEFNIGVEMGEVRVGPTVTQYSLKPDKGMKLSRIVALSNDLSLALAAHPIRIEAPIPGKSLVGIEVPNFKVAMVTLKELLESNEFRNRPHNMMIALGKDVAGKVWFGDLPKMPHLLVAGATNSGKTVCVNAIIMSLLYQNTAETLRLIMVDPKRVEFTLYNGIPHLLTPVITNVQKTVNALKWTIGEMDRRFEIFSQTHSRDIESYNLKHPNEKMPRIVFIIDELADLMMAAASEVEAGIIRIAQMARAVGIHLVVATQRPSVDIITGLMKANIPARIAFSVASIIDSRTILDCPGADKLLGRGDMLFLTAELSKPKRIQGAFVAEAEVKNVSEYLKEDGEAEYDETIVGKQQIGAGGTLNMFGGSTDDQDPMFEEAKQVILESGKASASLLQRRMKLGYARAARILDQLEAAGIIGPADGAKPREILTTETVIEDSSDNSGQELNVFDNEESKIETETEVEDEEVVDEVVEEEKY